MSTKKSRKSKTDKKQQVSHRNIVGLEIVLSLSLLLIIFVWLSLAVYDLDSSKAMLNHSFFTGKLGFHTAHLLSSLFGYAAFFIPLLILPPLVGVFYKPLRIHFLWFFLLILFWMPLQQLSGWDPLNWSFSGGTVGKLLLSAIFLPYLGEVGSWLLLIVALAVLFMVIFRTPLFSPITRFISSWIVAVYRQLQLKKESLTTPDDDNVEPLTDLSEVEDTIPEPPPIIEKRAKERDKPAEKPVETPTEENSVRTDIPVLSKQDDSDAAFASYKPRKIEGYILPSIDILEKDEKVELDKKSLEIQVHQTASIIEKTLQDYKVKIEVAAIKPGPVVTLYQMKLGDGERVGRVASLKDDLAIVVHGKQIRVVEKIPGTQYIGIEVPNDTRLMIRLHSIIASEQFQKQLGKGMPVALGQDVGGDTVISNLAKMPHLLVAGTTGSGKSVGVNAIIMSLLYTMSPDEVKFILIDPKGNEFNIYEGIPHLLMDVVTDPKMAAKSLQWVVGEMTERFRKLGENRVRDIGEYNKKREQINKNLQNEEDHLAFMPYIVVVIDEFADLMITAGKDVEQSVQRIAQKARAAGLHLIIATQRPTRDVITGTIKMNLPVRIAFRVASGIDSRTILDSGGAELLLGNGDMLFTPPGSSEPTRIHGAFVSTDEIKDTVKFISDQVPKDMQDERLNLEEAMPSGAESSESGDHDDLWDEVIAVIRREQKCSVSFLQRKLGIGYGRASRIVDHLEEAGLVSPPEGAQSKREVLISED